MTIRERIQVDSELISEKILHSTLIRCMKSHKGNNLKLAYFDFFFGARLCYILINARSIM